MKSSATCSWPECKELAVYCWPPFDRAIEPDPYCVVHLEDAKRTIVTEGPRFIPEKKGKPELATV